MAATYRTRIATHASYPQPAGQQATTAQENASGPHRNGWGPPASARLQLHVSEQLLDALYTLNELAVTEGVA